MIKYSVAAILILIVAFFTASSAFLYVYNVYLGKLISKLTVDIRKRILGKIYRAKYLYLMKRDIGYYNNAVTVEFSKVGSALKWLATLSVLIMLSLVYVFLAFAVNLRVTPTIVIAHRLPTIKNADYIYALDSGRIVEEGTFDSLIPKEGEFKDMIMHQKLV